MAAFITIHYTLVLLSLLVLLIHMATASASENGADSYVYEACSVTRYQDLCIRSLSTFSHTARRSPSKWARAGVSVTIGEAKDVSRFLSKLARSGSVKGKNRIALSDCVETIQDTLDNLHMSLGVLRRLDPGKFETQMGDLITWVSAALTDEDTCLDGFDEQEGDQGDRRSGSKRLVKVVKTRVSRATYMTSNALALVNRLAANGLGNLAN